MSHKSDWVGLCCKTLLHVYYKCQFMLRFVYIALLEMIIFMLSVSSSRLYKRTSPEAVKMLQDACDFNKDGELTNEELNCFMKYNTFLNFG